MKILRNKIFILALASFLTRSAAIIAYQGIDYYGGITNSYLHVIHNVLDGRGFVVHVDIAPLNTAGPEWSYEPFIDRPLGFSLLLLLPSIVSTHRIVLQLFFALLSVCSVLLLYMWGKNVANERTAFIAALLYALWPLSARIETTILPDAVASLFILGTLWLMFQSSRNNHPYRMMFLAGVTLGASTTIRSDIVLLPFCIVVVVLLIRGLQRWKLAGMLLAGFGLVLLLHTARNYQATSGRILPLGLGNGISMWEGISQFGDTLGTVYGDERMIAREGYHSWAYPNGIERDSKRFHEALNIIRNHPVWYAGVMVKRIGILVKPDRIVTAPLIPEPQEYFQQERNATLWNYVCEYPVGIFLQVILVVCQIAALVLACIAMVRFFNHRALWLPGAVIIYYIAVHICTNAEARYFYPMTPLILFFAVYGLSARRLHQKEQI